MMRLWKLVQFLHLADMPRAQVRDGADGVYAAVVHELAPDGYHDVRLEDRLQTGARKEIRDGRQARALRAVQFAQVRRPLVGVRHPPRGFEVAAVEAQAGQDAAGAENLGQDLDISHPVLQGQGVPGFLEHDRGRSSRIGRVVRVDANHGSVRLGRLGRIGRRPHRCGELPVEPVDSEAVRPDLTHVLLPDVDQRDLWPDPCQVASVDTPHVSGADDRDLHAVSPLSAARSPVTADGTPPWGRDVILIVALPMRNWPISSPVRATRGQRPLGRGQSAQIFGKDTRMVNPAWG